MMLDHHSEIHLSYSFEQLRDVVRVVRLVVIIRRARHPHEHPIINILTNSKTDQRRTRLYLGCRVLGALIACWPPVGNQNDQAIPAVGVP